MSNNNTNTPIVVIVAHPLAVDATPRPDCHRFHARIEGVNRATGNKVFLNLFTNRKTAAAANVRVLEIAEAEGIDVVQVQVSATTF